MNKRLYIAPKTQSIPSILREFADESLFRSYGIEAEELNEYIKQRNHFVKSVTRSIDKDYRIQTIIVTFVNGNTVSYKLTMEFGAPAYD